MKRPFAIAAVALLVAAPAVAQQGDRIAGGASFDVAPRLKPKVLYVDSLRAGESLFYGMELAEGERGHVSIKVAGRFDHPPIPLRLRMYNARRVEHPFGVRYESLAARGTATLQSATSRVGAPDPDYPLPGMHFFSISAGTPRGAGTIPELALEIRIDVQKVKPLASLATPTPTPSPETEEADEPSRAGLYILAFIASVFVSGLITTLVLKLSQTPRSLRTRF